MELLQLQLLYIFAAFIVTLIGALWPYIWVYFKVRDPANVDFVLPPKMARLLSFANCFACGVFLALCFTHLIPQSEMRWAQIQKWNAEGANGNVTSLERTIEMMRSPDATKQPSPSSSKNTAKTSAKPTPTPLSKPKPKTKKVKKDHEHDLHHNYPIGQLLLLAAFTGMFCVEMLFDRRRRLRLHNETNRSYPTPPLITLTKPSPPGVSPTSDANSQQLQFNDNTPTSTQSKDGTEGLTSDVEDEFEKQYVSLRDVQAANMSVSLSSSPAKDYGALRGCTGGLAGFRDSICSQLSQNGTISGGGGDEQLLEGKGTGNGGHLFHTGSNQDQLGGPKAMAFIFGVASHNLLEGLTLGLQTDMSAATSLFSGILLHGFLLSSAVTMALMRVWFESGLSHFRSVISLGILVTLRPVGGLVGLVIVGAPGFIAFVLASILQSLSAGIFVYITFVSMLPREFGEGCEAAEIESVANKCHFEVADSANGGSVSIKREWKIFSLTCGWTLLMLVSMALQ